MAPGSSASSTPVESNNPSNQHVTCVTGDVAIGTSRGLEQHDNFDGVLVLSGAENCSLNSHKAVWNADGLGQSRWIHDSRGRLLQREGLTFAIAG